MEVFDLLLGLSFEVINGRLTNFSVNDVVFDSRLDCKDSAFVCISGKNYDSHNDFDLVCDKGAKLVVVDRYIHTDSDVLVIKVESTRKALSFMCMNLFGSPHKKLNIIGITGTKGKTSTAIMLKRMLDNTSHKCGLIGSLGVVYKNKKINTINTTPDPYTLHSILKEMVDNEIDTVIIEISGVAIKQERVAGIHFDYTILTNIMLDYLDYNEFENEDDYIQTKARLFNQTENSIINGDEPYLELFKKESAGNLYTYGLTADVNLRANNISLIKDENFGLSYDIYDLKRTHVELYQVGRQNVYNSLAALYVMMLIGYEIEKYVKFIKNISVNGRAEMIKNKFDRKIFIDCAVRPIGFSSIFEAISEYKDDKLISVFSVDERSDTKERMELVKIACNYSDKCILSTGKYNILGKEIEKYIRESNIECKVFENRADAVKYAIKNSEKDDILLLLGTGRYDKSIFSCDYDVIRELAK